jgi:hypothetical protein
MNGKQFPQQSALPSPLLTNQKGEEEIVGCYQ